MIKKVKEIIKILEADGWYFDSQVGSHKHFKHPTKLGKVTVPDHGGSSTLGHQLVARILKQAGL